MKKCSKCNIEKNVASFRKDNKGKAGLRSECKQCEQTARQIRMLGSKVARPETARCASCAETKLLDAFRKSNKKTCKSCLQTQERVRRRFVRDNRKVLSPVIVSSDPRFEKTSQSMNGFFNTFTYTRDIANLHETRDAVVAFLSTLLSTPMKVSLEVEFVMLDTKNGKQFEVSRKTDKRTVSENNPAQVVDSQLNELDDLIFNSNYDQSGLTLLRFTQLSVYVNPFVISSGGTYVPLPQKIKDSQACINIQNFNDNKCFLWCLTAFIRRKRVDTKRDSNPSKLFLYNRPELIAQLDMTGVTYPVPLTQIPAIEKNNALSVNVYKLSELVVTEAGEQTVVYPISLVYPNYDLSLEPQRSIIEDRHVNMLLYKGHYTLIANTRRLFSSCVNGKHSAFICEWCGVSLFTTKKSLDVHELKCKFKFEHQKYILPETPTVSFRNFRKSIEAPFIIYADFESYFAPSDKLDTSKTVYNKQHKPMGFALFRVCRTAPEFNGELNMYIGPDADQRFVSSLLAEIAEIDAMLKQKRPLKMLPTDQAAFDSAKDCFLCSEPLNGDKVRDHDHLSGKYRGAAHSKCNMLYTKHACVVPVVFHNLEGYDLHLFIDALHSAGKDFEVIPKSKEKYLALTMKLHDSRTRVRFLDSLHFFTGSLADNAKKITQFKFSTDKQLQFKQVYPYSYFTSLDKLAETALPTDRAAWYNELKKAEVTDEELDHAHAVFAKYNCKNLLDYTKIYLSTDVYLLAEVFEKFRDLSLETYRLDPANYFTTPGLAWDAALKKTGVSLELLHDREMVDFFVEKGTMRGGISTVCRKKHATANNKYMPDFDPAAKSTFLMYFDVTNLYGYTMTGTLPTHGFRWFTPEELAAVDPRRLDPGKGYVLEVDLAYPAELKDRHAELPMAPEHFDGKLSPNLFDKFNYRLRLENLLYYLDHGLTLTRVLRVLEFEQSPWLRKYIDANTELRKVATDESAKNFYKLMNNAVYGKTMENVFGRKNFKLFGKHNSDKIIKCTRDPKFKKEHLLTENMVILELQKEEIVFDKPIYIGFSILELSKLHMYTLHYDKIKNLYGDKATLMYMDTDSLVYEIETHDVYADLAHLSGDPLLSKNGGIFDLSVYPKTVPWYADSNRGVLGTLKDEFASHDGRLNMVTEFSCLRSKCYSLTTLAGEEVKKCKGVVKTELNRLSHADFVKCNAGGGVVEVTQTTFKTHNHTIYTVQTTKDGLSRADNKRQPDPLLGDMYTVPWGYTK